ncbi:hypothetical protein [Chromatocurvus halotolerans]|uniref:Uncharacterized protein n=1 Tax=Chromatocurvus halotolerans TaxID=1132028 RepID=A0A4R2KM97_9GAMM|nr:hypothetical protein [Chromatocurvus halotolerans]TCO73762.1 hypothetical protein EV688_11579 [Chromatocurvus halotolerans]
MLKAEHAKAMGRGQRAARRRPQKKPNLLLVKPPAQKEAGLITLVARVVVAWVRQW